MMLLAQILGGIFGLAIVWIPVHFFEQRNKKQLAQEFAHELVKIRNTQKLGAEIK